MLLFLMRRSRGLAAIAQAFAPSVSLEFVAFNLDLDSGAKARDGYHMFPTQTCILLKHSAAASTHLYVLTVAAAVPGCEAGKGERPGGRSAIADAAYQDSWFQETRHWPATTRLTVRRLSAALSDMSGSCQCVIHTVR